MNETIAIDPESIKTASTAELLTLSRSLGLDTGLFGLEIPEGWYAQAREACKQGDLGEVHRKRLIEFTRRAREYWLIRAETDFAGDSWQEKAGAAVEQQKVIAAFSSEPSPNVRALSSILDESSESVLESKYSSDIDTSVAAYLTALTPLILKSSELHIIDPYAYELARPNKRRRFLDFVLGVSSIAQRSKRPTYALFLHSWAEQIESRKFDEADVTKWFNEIRLELDGHPSNPLLDLKLIIRDDHVEHDRFVLGPRGGVTLGRGVAFLLQEESTHISYLSKTDHESKHTRFVGSIKQHWHR